MGHARRMRRAAVLVITMLGGLGLLLGPAAADRGPQPADRPASYGFLKAQVYVSPGLGEVAVGMPNARTVKVQHRTEGGTWSKPTVLFEKAGVTYGQIDGRASAGGWRCWSRATRRTTRTRRPCTAGRSSPRTW